MTGLFNNKTNKTEYRIIDEKSHKLRKCTHEDDAPYFDFHDFKNWYHNPLCFPKNDKVYMRSSWWGKNFASPLMIIAKCQETEERKRRGKICKSDKEIAEFLDKTFFYTFYQRTVIQPDIFEGEANHWPHKSKRN